jgi:hypothetical protein
MILPRLKTSNLMFEDVSLQEEGKYILIFHSGNNRGSLSCDGIAIDKVDKSVTVFKGGNVIAAFSEDFSYIMAQRKLVNVISTEDNIERMIADAKAMKEVQEKHPELVEVEAPPLQTGHYL